MGASRDCHHLSATGLSVTASGLRHHQLKGVAFTVVYTAVVTFVILKVLDLVMGLRVTEEEEAVGLDLALHNERGYNL
ncbi:hypothetical protein [Pseudomonas aeruginosa]|uniref:hypothetical protein n=1 Tax=Pseudomonas aeruginosa TaxID=287 RepID=UPI00215037A9|nr:hypothetical protein [Pseudomonas aeruginosa]